MKKITYTNQSYHIIFIKYAKKNQFKLVSKVSEINKILHTLTSTNLDGFFLLIEHNFLLKKCRKHKRSSEKFEYETIERTVSIHFILR